jgi:hypothetical protein
VLRPLPHRQNIEVTCVNEYVFSEYRLRLRDYLPEIPRAASRGRVSCGARLDDAAWKEYILTLSQ